MFNLGLEVGMMPDESRDNFVTWLPQGNGDFSVTFAWTAIREIYPIIEWHGVVWFKNHVPRWSFVPWLAIQQKVCILVID